MKERAAEAMREGRGVIDFYRLKQYRNTGSGWR